MTQNGPRAIPASQNPQELIGGLLDRGYTQAAEQTLRAISRSMTDPRGIIQTRLAQFDAEVARLAEAGEPLRTDNPVLRALVADIETVSGRNAALIDGAAGDVAQSGLDSAATATRQLALPGFDDRMLADIGVRWNTPDPAAVARLVDYVNKPAWANDVENYANAVTDVVNRLAITGIADGRNPLATARLIRAALQGGGDGESVPLYAANNLMRTLQLESYRSAAPMHQMANADILTEQVRIGTLDDRICLCCLSLHGTRVPLGEKIQDHHQGRCTSIAVVKGREVSVTTGEQWWDTLPEDRQRQIAGDSNWEAINAGRLGLRDFVQPYRDPVFDDMIREASLVGVLGGEADQYYRMARERRKGNR